LPQQPRYDYGVHGGLTTQLVSFGHNAVVSKGLLLVALGPSLAMTFSNIRLNDENLASMRNVVYEMSKFSSI
jgi:hypothetical protein